MPVRPVWIEMTVFGSDGSSIARRFYIDPNIADRIAYPPPPWNQGSDMKMPGPTVVDWACEELLRNRSVP